MSFGTHDRTARKQACFLRGHEGGVIKIGGERDRRGDQARKSEFSWTQYYKERNGREPMKCMQYGGSRKKEAAGLLVDVFKGSSTVTLLSDQRNG